MNKATSMMRGVKFLYIIGHPNSDVGDTLIDISTDLSSALRRYNTSARGIRAAKDGGAGQLCAAILLPHWRNISAPDLLRLWRSSRKLYCRVRFGIWIAHALRLACVVDRSLLVRAGARKALPHVAARLPATDIERDTSSSASTTSQQQQQQHQQQQQQRRRRRGRRPSTSDLAVAQHAQLLSLEPDDIETTLSQLFLDASYVQTSRQLDYDTLDRLNTLCHKKNDLCFTTGRVRNVAPKRTTRVARTEYSNRIAGHAAALRAASARGLRYSSGDDDTKRDVATMSDATLCALETVMYCAEMQVADRAALTLVRHLEHIAGAKRKRSSVCEATAVHASDVALIDCANESGKIDNHLLVQRADACYSDANEYQGRRLARVKVHRAGICYCGSSQSFARTVLVRDWRRGGSPRRAKECSVCKRNTLQFRLFRTDVAQLKEDATAVRPMLSDRRVLRALMLNVERVSDIEQYAREAHHEAEELLQLRKRGRSESSVAMEQRKEASLIDAALLRLILNED